MKINRPFAELPLDLSCVEKACRLHDIKQLHNLFNDSKLILVTTNEVHNYFLEYSNYEITYDVDELSKVLSQHTGSLFNSSGDFKLHFKMHLPKATWQALGKLLRFEISNCFKQVFNDKGDLQNWYKELFIDKQLVELYQCFGEVNVKFELFNIFALCYCQLFKDYISPGDKDCSTVIIKLAKAELLAYKNTAKSLSNLENTLNKIDDSYKVKDKIIKIFNQANLFFFSNKFLSKQSIKSCLDDVCEIVSADNPSIIINRLQSKVSLLKAQTSNKYLYLFAGTISVFIGSFLIVAGLINATLASPLVVGGLVTSGLTFFGGGSTIFTKGLPEYFADSVNDFVSQTKNIELDYKLNLF